ncbi:Hypothetical_protein [Hexamita inflata]|uniref:Hypothetical_protein n=1 Tax=Hexamita inflata TaxID=28002 RepID=A0AA86Q7J6_9EUKA|nr:Hypothetical protein HINF_LOCUS38487 [Hexamita inflata]
MSNQRYACLCINLSAMQVRFNNIEAFLQILYYNRSSKLPNASSCRLAGNALRPQYVFSGLPLVSWLYMQSCCSCLFACSQCAAFLFSQRFLRLCYAGLRALNQLDHYILIWLEQAEADKICQPLSRRPIQQSIQLRSGIILIILKSTIQYQNINYFPLQNDISVLQIDLSSTLQNKYKMKLEIDIA